ncbi:MAG TPA: response regulator [Thermoanaerobaculia bacterium]|nr:response regulator [Thermoanaerobaculia bacterium]
MSLVFFEEHRSRYMIRCHHCGEKFDAVNATWCRCTTRVPTLECPACRQCFCAAPHGYKLDFWAGAPSDFVRRKPFRQEAATPPAALTRPLVLVADDIPSMRLLATAMLRRLGYGVIVAQDGEEALRLTREMKPDLVLTDALMPRLDGRELTRRIKDDPELAGTRVVVMSAVYTAPKHQAEAIARFRADDFLVKPFDVRILREVLEALIGPAAAGDASEESFAAS